MAQIFEDWTLPPAPGRKFGLYGFFYGWDEHPGKVAVFEKHIVATDSVGGADLARVVIENKGKSRKLVRCSDEQFERALEAIQNEYSEEEQESAFEESIKRLMKATTTKGWQEGSEAFERHRHSCDQCRTWSRTNPILTCATGRRLLEAMGRAAAR